MTLGRETPAGLVKKDLNTSEDHGFTLPENIREAFGEKDFKWVEYHVSTAGSEVSFIPSLIPSSLLPSCHPQFFRSHLPSLTPSFHLPFLSQLRPRSLVSFFPLWLLSSVRIHRGPDLVLKVLL